MKSKQVSVYSLTQEVIEYLFRLKLGRDPSPLDYVFQSNYIIDGTMSVELFAKSLEMIPEGRARLGMLHDLYLDEEFYADGCKFNIPAASGLAFSLSQPEGYEPWAWPRFLSECKPGMTVIDIGANWGIYAIPAARRVGPRGKVFAFEAARENAKMLIRNAIGNDIANIELLTTAVSDRFGMAALPRKRPDNSGYVSLDRTDAASASMEWEPLSTMPVDAMRGVMGRIDLIKMDIEGAEYRACLGAEAIIKEDRPIIFTEYCPILLRSISNVDPGDLLAIFLNLDYKIDILHYEGPSERLEGTTNDIIARIIAQCAHDKIHDHIDLKFTP